jgi:hypothetical protein
MQTFKQWLERKCLKFPSDCEKPATIIRRAQRNCRVDHGGPHDKVFTKGGNFVASIPRHSISRHTCKDIIKDVEEKC